MSANVRFGAFLRCMIISWKNNQDEEVLEATSFEGFSLCKGGSSYAHETQAALQASWLPSIDE